MALSIPHLSLITTLTLLTLVSITLLGLKSTFYTFIHAHDNEAFFPDDNPNSQVIYALPQHLNKLVPQFTIVSAVLSLISVAIVGVFLWMTRKNEKRTKTRSAMRVFTPLLTINFIIALISMIYTLSIHHTSAHVSLNSLLGFEAPGNLQLNHEMFDLETWTCDLGRQLAEDRGYAQQCRIERMGRWMMVVETVGAGLVLMVTIWAMRKEKKTINKTEDKGKGKQDSEDGGWI